MDKDILIIDDIPENIKVLGSILDKEPYAISFATDGAQALEMIEEQDFDLILLDIMMPGMDGYEVCRRTKAMPLKKDIPIIFLTARSEKADIVKGLELGAVDYVTKPFNSHELIARVRTHLELKELRDAILEKNKALEQTNAELLLSLEKIKVLEGILPICSFCKKIRDEKDEWLPLEAFISRRSDINFSHGMCPDCGKIHYPDFYPDKSK
jgi:DNA-binding response OmpR family regulator